MLLAASDSQLLAAREQMAISLGFHIVLSCFGVAFPALIYLAHRRGLRGDADALTLAKRWSKVAAVLFAVGAVSGTVLSFEMGLLWPGLMSQFGDVLGLPFALEGIAFFIEAIFVGIYLYGWDRLPPRVHIRALIPMIAAGVMGTFCVIAVNAWMNSPSGFRLEQTATGMRVVDVNPVEAMFNNAVWLQFLHMFVATYMVVGFATAAVYAVGLVRGRRDGLHTKGFTLAFAMASVGAVVQPFIGHVAGMRLAEHQPVKLAAMELATTTEHNGALNIGGFLIDGTVHGAIRLPGISSLLARGWFNRDVPGLDIVPKADQPNANIVHNSFQIMVGIGTLLMLFSIWFWWRRRYRWRGRSADPTTSSGFLRVAVVAGPAAVIAMEAGWVTTEVGRQPWIVQDILRVRDAVTPNSGIWITFTITVLLYATLTVVACIVLRSMSRRWRDTDAADLPTPYGPPSEGRH
jgi:cytochrome d ubiquinol oxidase subunit I